MARERPGGVARGFFGLTDPAWHEYLAARRGYVTVTTDHVFRVGERLHADYENGRSYYGLDGTRIALPEQDGLRPERELLDWHGRTLFRG